MESGGEWGRLIAQQRAREGDGRERGRGECTGRE